MRWCCKSISPSVCSDFLNNLRPREDKQIVEGALRSVTIHRFGLLRITFVYMVLNSLVGAGEIHVRVGPNVRVGQEGTRQGEPYVAADPGHAENLIISALETVSGLAGGGLTSQCYVSSDGGQRWSASELPGLRAALLKHRFVTVQDGWITFAPNGEAFYSTLPTTLHGQEPIYVFRSTDKGHTWSGPTKIGSANFDQPKTIAIVRDGKVRLYIAASTGRGRAVLLDSDDDAETFRSLGPMPAKVTPYRALKPLVLANGSILLPYSGFLPHSPPGVYIARSEDGGTTFGAPAHALRLDRGSQGTLDFAVDLSQGKYRGRIYAVWEEGSFGPHMVREGNRLVGHESGARRDVMVAHSNDDGGTWSGVEILRAKGRGPSALPTMAVSRGIVGVLWVQNERYEVDPRSYDAWFAASANGGESFSSPVRVSSKTSRPLARLNPGLSFASGPRGGDYIGIAAAADGSFHAAWIDARDGVFRLYTARIDVQR